MINCFDDSNNELLGLFLISFSISNFNFSIFFFISAISFSLVLSIKIVLISPSKVEYNVIQFSNISLNLL